MLPTAFYYKIGKFFAYGEKFWCVYVEELQQFRVNFNFPYVYTGHYYLKIFKFFFRETIKFYKYRRPQLNTWSGFYVLRAIEVD